MTDVEEAVRQFQRHVGAPAPTWPELSDDDKETLKGLADALKHYSQFFKHEFKAHDKQIDLRTELILEEVAEIFESLANGDKVATLDGLVDAVYVIVGTATQFGLPFSQAFDLVHASNMTKSSAAARHAGDKGKGANYVPANLNRLFIDSQEHG